MGREVRAWRSPPSFANNLLPPLQGGAVKITKYLLVRAHFYTRFRSVKGAPKVLKIICGI